MKVFLDEKGNLSVRAETTVESYALAHWHREWSRSTTATLRVECAEISTGESQMKTVMPPEDPAPAQTVPAGPAGEPVPRMSSGATLTLVDMLARNAARTSCMDFAYKPTWYFISQAACVGSTTAAQICREAGVDPYAPLPARARPSSDDERVHELEGYLREILSWRVRQGTMVDKCWFPMQEVRERAAAAVGMRNASGDNAIWDAK